MSKSRVTVLSAILVAIALSAGLLLGMAGGSGEAASPAVPGAPTTQPSTSVAPQSSSPSDGGSQYQSQPQPEPQPQPQPDPGVLAVGPSMIDLPKGQWTAQFAIANIGGSDMSWFAVGVPSTVSLSATKGTLAAGEETIVTATVDHTKLAKGGFSLTLHISANDTAEAVTITGTKEIKVIGPVGPQVLTPKN